jgi:MYXO-CTERM domain-containing protein
MKLAPAVVAVALSLSFASVASANGRFPYANQLVVDPSDNKHIVLRTTYGVVQTFDSGANWKWLCETSVGYGGKFDPAIGVTKTGRILIGLFDGLSSSSDRGCSFERVGVDIFTKQYVIDLVVEQKDPSRVVAITSTGLGDAGFHVAVGESLDSGATWKAAGVDLPKDFNSETIEVAPSRTERIYASGIVGMPRVGAIEKSDDRGATWERLPIDLGKDGLAPYLSAVDRNNPDVVWVRIDGDAALMAPDRLLVSRDGAKTWTEVASIPGEMLGFALSPDGSKVAFGGPTDGVFVASTTDPKPVRVSTFGARCLTWTPDGLYLCANEYPDGFTVGLSKDEGKTFAPIYQLANLSPLECAPSTSTGALCPKDWPGVQATIGAAPIEETGPMPVDTGRPGTTTPPATTSCGCSVPGRAAGSLGLFALALAGFLRLLRRRR